MTKVPVEKQTEGERVNHRCLNTDVLRVMYPGGETVSGGYEITTVTILLY